MAKVTKVNRNILCLRYTQERDDSDYGTCLWAEFLFDLDEYQLNINSDCGSYSYGWDISPREPFLKLMARINRGYLLSKISEESRVDAKATMEGLENLIKQALAVGEIDSEDATDITERWADIVTYVDEVNRLTDALLLEIREYCWEPDYENLEDSIASDFPVGAKKVAEIFELYIQPKIKEMSVDVAQSK